MENVLQKKTYFITNTPRFFQHYVVNFYFKKYSSKIMQKTSEHGFL